MANEDVVSLALDTIAKGKQALIFVNTKRSAEKVAEDIAKKCRISSSQELSLSLKHASNHTDQCKRLASCAEKNVAFHHAGLHSKQKRLIETAFKQRTLSIICATPTLAIGVDTPAFRTIIRDLKRYGQRGLSWIPVLEYLQMSGRAGRPNYDAIGESIVICKSEMEREEITAKYLHGQPEPIQSKLAVEPVLRTYILTLIATKFCKSHQDLLAFFKESFWAHQYKDHHRLETIITKMTDLLEDWGFIISTAKDDFVSAELIADQSYRASKLGQRVAELYLDPYTAHHLIKGLQRAASIQLTELSFLQLISNTLEMRPLLRVRTKEYELVEEVLVTNNGSFLQNEPSMYDQEYNEFLDSVKTARFLQEWINEVHEQHLLDTFSIRPGETRAKLDIADWLLYCCDELTKLLGFQALRTPVGKLRLRIKHGAKEELIPLLRLKGIGRMRARKLYQNNIRTLGDVKKADILALSQLIGKNIANSIHKQVGREVTAVSPRKRKGQLGLHKY